MKTKTAALLVLATTLLTSCSTTFYQMYNTEASEGMVKKENNLIFEDDNCIISYDLWKDGGDIGFVFYNKTDENIYLNLDESFFVRNGIAHDYYKDRIFGKSFSSGITTSVSTTASGLGYNYLNVVNLLSVNKKAKTESSSGYSVSHIEKNMITIPPKTSKVISEYGISNSIYRDCNLYLHPTKSQIKTERFSKSDSPFTFSNQLAYQVGDSDDLIKLENAFYVSEITNYPEKEMVKSNRAEFCGQKGLTETKVFTNASPSKFYIKYDKIKHWKH